MKKSDIISLVQGKFLEATAHCLPAEEFYKWYKFRKQISDIFNDIVKDEQSLYTQCGIKQGQKDIPAATKEKFMKVYQTFLDENVTVEISSRIPFSFYKEIYDENKTSTKDVFSNIFVESLVIANLFDQP